jgi:hypothetical protein
MNMPIDPCPNSSPYLLDVHSEELQVSCMDSSGSLVQPDMNIILIQYMRSLRSDEYLPPLLHDTTLLNV